MGVLGHSEWVDFAIVPRLPRPGEILHTERLLGGGRRRRRGRRRADGQAHRRRRVRHRARPRRPRPRDRGAARGQGVTVHAAARDGRQRRGFVYLTDDGERTITVLGERLVPHGDDALPWDLFARLDGVYVTGGDPAALRAARAARVIVATPRADDALRDAGVPVDVLVHSGNDEDERLDPPRSTRRRARSSPPSGARAAAGRGSSAAAAGSPRRCRGSASTPTARATRSPRGSRPGSRRGCRSPRPCASARAAAPRT